MVLLSLSIRLYIRLHVQNHFGVDDGLVVFGVLLLIAAMGMLYHFVDMMFMSEALALGDKDIELSFNVIQDALSFKKWATISLITTWVAIYTVKASFLVLFRKLVDRIRPLIIYWWFVVAYTIVLGLYGVTTYIVPCPNFNSFVSCKYACQEVHASVHFLHHLQCPVPKAQGRTGPSDGHPRRWHLTWLVIYSVRLKSVRSKHFQANAA